MEDKETLLFEVKLDIPGVKEKAELARAAIAQLRLEKVATDKELREKKISAQEYAQSMQAIDTQLSRAQGQLKNYSKILSDNEKVTQAAEGSNDQLRAKLALLVPTWNAASKADREYNDSIKAVGIQIRELTQELKDNEESLGDHRRSVGDYAKGIRIAGASVGEMQESLKGGYEAFKVFTNGISLAKGGLIALGAVPILIFLTGFVLLLQKSQGAMDKLAQYFKAGELALSALTSGLIKNTQIILEAFTSWDKFKNLFSDLKDNAQATTSAMGEAARAGMQIAAANQQIEESEIALSVVRAKNRADIERYKQLAEDTSKSNAVRSAAAKKAYDLENSTLQQSLKLQKQRIASAELEYKYSLKTREDRKKVAEEQVRYSELEEESLGKQTELNNNLNSIRQDGITKAKEAAALAAQEEIAHYERMIILAKQKGQDTLMLEEILIRKKANANLLGEKMGAQQRKLIEVQANAEILALRVAHAAELENRIVEARKNEIGASLALARAGSKEELNLQIEAIRAETRVRLIDIESQRKLNKITAEEEFNAKSNAVLNEGKAIQALQQQFEEADVQRQASLTEDRLTFEERANDVRLSDLRGLAGERIDLEEKTQLELLDIARKYNKITDEEYESRRKAIEARAEGDRRAVNRQIAEDEINDEKARAESRAARSRQGTKEELNARIDAINAERKSALNAEKLTADQRKAINDKANREIADAQTEFSRNQISSILDTASQASDALSKIFEAQSQRESDLLEKQQSAALASVGLSAEARTKVEEKFAARKEELDRKAAERRRKIATIENIIATARAVTEAQILPPPFDIIKTVLAVATGAVQQAVIASQQFARGGEIDGPSHAQGGVKFRVGGRTVELEGGEGVVNKRSMAMPGVRERVSALNVLGGGVPFKGLTRHSYNPYRMEYGGIVSGASGGSSVDYAQITNMVVVAVKNLPPSIVQVSAIRNGVGKQVRVESRADIGV